MKALYGWDVDKWIFYGGYPGTGTLVDTPGTWQNYVTDSLIETVLAKDVLQMQSVAKPALLRHLFALSAAHPAQIFSYNKMFGQLQDAGNTTTLSHYLKLLESAYLIMRTGNVPAGSEGQKRQQPQDYLMEQCPCHGAPFKIFCGNTERSRMVGVSCGKRGRWSPAQSPP